MKYLLFILILLILPLISGATEELPALDLGTYEQNKPAHLFLDCTNQTAVCSTSALCNITRIQFPNGSLSVSNVRMGFAFHPNANYTFNDTATVGLYKGTQLCCDNNVCGTRTFEFLINPSGVPPSLQRTDTLSRTIYLIFAISIILFVSSLFTKSLPIKVTFFVFSATFVLIGVNMLFITMQDEIVNPKIVEFFDTFTAISFYLYWFFGGLLLVVWFLTTLSNILFQKKQKEMQLYGGDWQ